jgi:hypothetical protein
MSKEAKLLEFKIIVVGSATMLISKDAMLLSSTPNLHFHLLVEVKQHKNNMCFCLFVGLH